MEKQEIHPRVSVNAVSSFNWTTEQDVAFWQAIKVPSVGISLAKLEPDVSAGVSHIRASGIPISTVVGGARGSKFNFIDPQARKNSLERLTKVIDVAHELRSPSCYFLTGGTPSRMPSDEALPIFVDAIAPARQYAKDRGIRLSLEHNAQSTRESGFVQSLADAVTVAREAEIGVCVELQNCWTELRLGKIFERNMHQFSLVQVSDYVVGTTERISRAVPGDGDMPLEWMIGLLLEAGYKGIFDIEILGPKIEEEGYAVAIPRSVSWLSNLLWRLGA